MGSCFGKKPVVQAQQTQQSSTTALQPVLDKYYGLLDRATQTSYAPYDPNTGKQVAGFTAPQYQAFSNIDAGIAAPYLNNASNLAMSGAQPVTAAGIQAYMDPYTNEVVNSTMADFGVQNARQISDVTGKARMAGSLGGDREAVVQALTQEQQNRVQAPVIAGLRSQGYSQALSAAQQDKARTLQASGLQANLVPLSYTDTQGLLMSGGMQQALDQARLDAASQNAAAASAYPFQTQQWLAGIMGAASPNMGSTTNSTGTKTQDEVGGKPNYVNAALGGISLLGSFGLADGGRVPGISAGGYIPQPIMPTGGIRPSNAGGDISMARSPTVSDHLSDVMGAIKQGRQAGKSLGNVGQTMRTDTGPGGWSNMVTYDSGNPLAGFGNNLRYGISNVGNGIASAMGFAVGGEVPGFPTEPKMPFDEATGGAGLSPFMTMLAAEQGRGQGPVSAPGLSVAPAMTEPRVMERAATTAGVPYRDMPPPPPIANPGPGIVAPTPPPVEAPSSSGGISGAMQWFGTPEGKSALRNFGWNMLSRASPQYAGVGGTFQATGESGGLAERGWREDQKSMRERQIEDAKLALMKRAQDIRDAQAQHSLNMIPYQQRKIDADTRLAEARADAEIRTNPSRIALLEAQAKAAATKASTPQITPAQKAVDTAFGKEYAEFVVGGGFADAEKGIKQLSGVVGELTGKDPISGKEVSKKNLTGGFMAVTPQSSHKILFPEAADRAEQVQEIVQRNLRLVLGAQFTQKEGEALISRAYNPALDEKYNGERLSRLMEAMKKGLAAKKAAAEYYEKNGTLIGYKGATRITLGDIESWAGFTPQSGAKPDRSTAISEARKAIAAGKDPAGVRAKLRQWGYELEAN